MDRTHHNALRKARSFLRKAHEVVDDDEVAHATEDGAYLWFVQFITDNGTPEQKEIAGVLLEISRLEFSRWRA